MFRVSKFVVVMMRIRIILFFAFFVCFVDLASARILGSRPTSRLIIVCSLVSFASNERAGESLICFTVRRDGPGDSSYQ